MLRTLTIAVIALLAAATARAQAPPLADSGRLLGTAGVANIEGAGGGGLATWATIAGYGTRDAIGGTAHYTFVNLPGYQLHSFGASIGLFNRVELSYARQVFDTGATGRILGIGAGYTFDQDIAGVKVRLFGDAVYDQDSLIPQLAVGMQYKINNRGALLRAIGARDDQGADFYVSATKILLSESLLLDATLRFTRANQLGLLGFGGDRSDAYHPEFEGSAAYLLNRQVAIGGEYRTKPDNLGFAHESNWYDLFVAVFLNKHVSATLAYVDLGSIATRKDQQGVYVSLQLGL
ncbi:MAG: DUF3034 family protein [Acidisphaera sp.]|nr:DUF3034 family protein [Acidisphaera sp.]